MNEVYPIWLASYPRSGNTYLRALLANYLSDGAAPLSLDDIVKSTLGEHVEPLWEALTGKPLAERTFSVQWRNRQAYFAELRARLTPQRRMIKTHTLNGLIEGAPAFQFTASDRIIHLVRHPCDVAVSAAHFYGVTLDEQVRRMLSPGLMIDNPSQGREVLGSWTQHTAWWLEERRAPRLTVRYCDLVENTETALSSILRFLDIAPDPERIARAIRFASFDGLRDRERTHGFLEAPQREDARFFRVGQPFQWPKALTADQAGRLIFANRRLLDDLGFSDYVERRFLEEIAREAG